MFKGIHCDLDEEQVYSFKNNIVFKGIHCDLDEEQVPENDIFWRISFNIKFEFLE